MLQDFEKEQPIAFKIMKNVITKNRCSHAYLIEAKEYTRKNDIVLAFAKYLLCQNHHLTKEDATNCSVCSKDIENIIDLKWIQAEGLWIKKFQLEELQNDFGKKSIIGTKKIYVIDETEKLNTASANSILKFLEEPEDNIIALLIVDNIYQILPTIISRCQIIQLKENEHKKVVSTKESIKEIYQLKEIEQKQEELLLKKIDKVILFARFLEKNGQATLLYENSIWLDMFSSKEDMLFGLSLLLHFYRDILNYKGERFLEVFEEHQKEITEISNKNTISSLCDKINIIMEAKDSIKYNLNLNLVIDHLIYKMEEVNVCSK